MTWFTGCINQDCYSEQSEESKFSIPLLLKVKNSIYASTGSRKSSCGIVAILIGSISIRYYKFIILRLTRKNGYGSS
jgi:hypothetical protein